MIPLTDNEREILALAAQGDVLPRWPDHAYETIGRLQAKGLIRLGRLTDCGRDILIADLFRLMAEQSEIIRELKARADHQETIDIERNWSGE